MMKVKDQMKTKLFILLLFLFVAVPVSAQSPTTNGNIRDKVQQKLAASSKIPSSYIGSVTDISESTLQIDKFDIAKQTGDSGEIEQVETSEATKFVNIGKTTKTISFSDIAIGDFIVAMGYKNENGVLESKRILVIEPLKPSTRKSYFGEVVSATKNKITLKVDDSEKTFNITKNTDLIDYASNEEIKLTDFEESDNIIVVSTDDENARSVFLLTSPETTNAPQEE